MLEGCGVDLKLRDALLKQAKSWQELLDVYRQWPAYKASRMPTCHSGQGLDLLMGGPDIAVEPMVLPIQPTTEVTYDTDGNAYLGTYLLGEKAAKTLFSIGGRFAGQKIGQDSSEAFISLFRQARDNFLTQVASPSLYGVTHKDDLGRPVLDMLGVGDKPLRDLRAFACGVAKEMADSEYTEILLRTPLTRPMPLLVMEFVEKEALMGNGWRRFHRVAVSADWRVNRLWSGIINEQTLHTVAMEYALGEDTILTVENLRENLASRMGDGAMLRNAIILMLDMSSVVDPWDSHRVWTALFRRMWPESEFQNLTGSLGEFGFTPSTLVVGGDVLTLAMANAQSRSGVAAWQREACFWVAVASWRAGRE